MTGNMLPHTRLCGSPQWPEDNVWSSYDISWPAMCNDSTLWKHTNQFDPLHQCGYPSLQHIQTLLSFTTILHSTYHLAYNQAVVKVNGFPVSATIWTMLTRPMRLWEVSNFPSLQFSGQALLSPDASWVHPAILGNNPVILLTLSHFSRRGPLSGTPWKPPFSYGTKFFQLAANKQQRQYMDWGYSPIAGGLLGRIRLWCWE